MVPQIDNTDFARLLEQGSPYVLDVRETEEYAAGHVPGARNVPLSVLPVRLADVPKDRPVYAVCRSGNRSGQATELLRSAGVDATNVAGGTTAWAEAGRPLSTDPSA